MKDILVYLDGTSQDETRILQAAALADAHGSHLTGLFINPLPNLTATSAPVYASEQLIVTLQKEAVEAGDRVEHTIRARFDKLGMPNEVRRIDAVEAQIGAVLARESRTVDIVVGTRFYGHEHSDADVMEAVLFHSGTACLLVPPSQQPLEFERIMIGWINTAQSSRAVRAALPLLAKAKNVVVVMVHKNEPPEYQGEAPGTDIARYLSRHGISVEVQHLSGWHKPAEAILGEAEKRQTDLVVMGGYGHSRFQEWVLGGVTRDIMTSATIPVLLAH
jgi:nucleotide-binding universal stress UspA family protein